MIDSADDYSPELDEPVYSVRELAVLFGELDENNLPNVRRYLGHLAAGMDASAAWKSAGLPGDFHDQVAGTIPVFLGRPRALFGQ